MEISYLAFPDGGLKYSCASCGRCCKGYGFGGSRQDIAALQEKRPYLNAMTHYKAYSEHLTTLFNVSSGCFMLGAKGCTLESRWCHTSKPLVCNLFPFTEVLLVGNMPVVVPQLKCCLVAAKNSSCSAHKMVREWLDDVPVETFRPVEIDLPYRMMAVSWVRGEAFIRDTLPALGSIHNLPELVDYCLNMFHSARPIAEKPLELWADCLRLDLAELQNRFTKTEIDTFLMLIPTLRVHGLKMGIEYAQLGSWLAGLVVLTALLRGTAARPELLALDIDAILQREEQMLKLLPAMLWPVILPKRASGHRLYQIWEKQQEQPFGEIVRQYMAEANGFSGLYLRAVASIF